jgi:deoxyadenosine/deoxycytidine kinase
MCYCYTYAESNLLEQLKAHVATYKQLIERRNNPGEKDNLTWAQAYIDKTEKNYDAVITGLSTVQSNPYAYFMMGQAALTKGDRQAAKDYFTKVKNWNEFSFNQAVVWNRVHQELEKLKE